MNIEEIQADIIDEFSMLDGDMEMSINYVMELGEKLPEYPEEYRDEEHIVKGCQSKVWMTAELQGEKVVFMADSNTAITKGLVSLLVRVLSDKTPDEILNSELHFPGKIGMNRFIGTQRSNGFAAMIKQMKMYALGLKTQISA